MIKISRDNFPPSDRYQIGPNKGNEKWRVFENRVIQAFKNNPVPFTNSTYNYPEHPSYELWKNELINNQGKKCCYCEKSIDRGDLEHYRPKKGWKQNRGSAISRPGYYWLSYRWKNLLLSCKICNSSAHKGNMFPITGTRASTPTCDLNAETCSLINPDEENPLNEISFYKSTPISKGTKGTETISLLDLQNRSDIKQNRDDKWTMYDLASKVSKLSVQPGISQNDIDDASDRMRIAEKNKQPFSGMIKENIRNGTF
jgi:hypothetical protein